MPAKFIKCYKYTAPDGQQFDTLAEEQKHELSLILDGYSGTDKESMCAFLVTNGLEVSAILRQKERKNASPKTRKPRKVAGKAETPENRE